MCLPRCSETMGASYRKTKCLKLEGAGPITFSGIHVARADQDLTFAEHFLTLAERRRGNASNEKSASHKARMRATSYSLHATSRAIQIRT
jgi:hypothetical protein